MSISPPDESVRLADLGPERAADSDWEPRSRAAGLRLPVVIESLTVWRETSSSLASVISPPQPTSFSSFLSVILLLPATFSVWDASLLPAFPLDSATVRLPRPFSSLLLISLLVTATPSPRCEPHWHWPGDSFSYAVKFWVLASAIFRRSMNPPRALSGLACLRQSFAPLERRRRRRVR